MIPFIEMYLHIWVLHWGLQTKVPVSNTSLSGERRVDISSYTHFCSFLMADWNRHLCLFKCFQTGLLFVALSLLWSCVSWSFGVATEIFLELDSVWVELIDNIELLSRLQFGHIVFTNYQRVYGSGVQTQLGKKTKAWLIITYKII